MRLTDLQTGKMLRLVFIDSRGRQCAVSVAWLLVTVFAQQRIDMQVQHTYSMHPGAACCGNCDRCRQVSPSDQELSLEYQGLALEVWSSLEDESTEVDSPTEVLTVASDPEPPPEKKQKVAPAAASSSKSASASASVRTAGSAPARTKKVLPMGPLGKAKTPKPRGSTLDDDDDDAGDSEGAEIDYEKYSDGVKYTVIRRLLAVFAPELNVYTHTHTHLHQCLACAHKTY